ncbi:MAG TPA: helix-turn-helix transcriptional regulator [Pyrinomonadaceae bacterium]|nr:helix-turn-helix transcriptional regulator [Pyrinomonadaceae bacterium]
MLVPKGFTLAAVAPATYSLEGNSEQVSEHAMALVALSHTTTEQQIYAAMLAEIAAVGTRVASFTMRRLMSLTGIAGYSTVRRGVNGLVNKLSIERQKVAGHEEGDQPPVVYLVFTPEEILGRRRAVGLSIYPKGLKDQQDASLVRTVSRIAGGRVLSRREVEVALCCAQGLTNAEIGLQLEVSEQTVKFHLRNIFAKIGVKRRTELVSRLLRDDVAAGIQPL